MADGEVTDGGEESIRDNSRTGVPANRGEYTARINRVIDHVQDNLDGDLSLEVLARIACFSPYHFHRIFRALVGEPCARFVRRVRLERAATRLAYGPGLSVTEIALDSGFSSLEGFTRAFRGQFNMSPTEWRSGGCRVEGKEGQTDRKNGQVPGKAGQDFRISRGYLVAGTNNLQWRIEMSERAGIPDVKVEVRDLPEKHVAYVRHIGPYQGDVELFGGLWERLMRWAGPRGLLQLPETECLTIYHDDPKVTEDEKLRASVSITVPPETEVEGEVGKMKVEGGRYAVAKFELRSDQFAAAWDAIYGGWLPESGFQPDDRPPFEVCLNNPEEHPEKKHLVEICVPVKPL